MSTSIATSTSTSSSAATRANFALQPLELASSTPSTPSTSSTSSTPVHPQMRRRSSTPTTSPSPSPPKPSAPSTKGNPLVVVAPPSSPPPPQTHSDVVRKELDQRLSAYLPACVRRRLEAPDSRRVPDTHETTVVSMFADVSGFTAMTESLAARGPVGAEFLGRHLNSYFEQLLRLVSSAGGDVFKFAGDAMLIFWPETKDDTLASLLRRAIQCALRIQSHLHKAELAPGVVLSVKMGIGLGGATIAHVGGVSDGATARMEYIAVGPALAQAFAAEHQAEPGHVICSPQCWQLVSMFFDGEPVRVGSAFQKVTAVHAPIRLASRRPSFTRDDPQLHDRMKQYVSRAVWPYLDAHDEFWGSELRDVTVLFINVGFSEDELAKMLDATGLQRLQDAFKLVQKCIFEYEGTLNKFLVDDKGSTVIAAFGLPPVTHENDPIRGILSSLAICAALGGMGLKASVGITTGVALCGVVGHQGNRREYTVLGDIVNLSARLMQKAKTENGGVITDEATKLYTHDVLHFEERPEIFVKGKNDSIKIHRPYPRMSILLEYHLSSAAARTGSGRRNAVPGVPGSAALALSPTKAHGATPGGGAVRATPIPNVMENMHRVQVRDAQRRLSMRAERQAANAPAIIESDAFQKLRATLLQSTSQLNRFSNGGSFILEGDIGVGKTVLLRSALQRLDSGYTVCVGTASPFATRKPYAVWAEIVTKCALEGHAELAASNTSVLSAEAAMHSLQRNDFSKEVERRRRVATFVRRKIRDGAAPNTTLIKYAHLLNGILDTNFEALIEEEPATPEMTTEFTATAPVCLSVDVGGGARLPLRDNNNDEVDGAAEPRARAVTDVTSPSKMHVKEEDIAAWFLGLLEMDLAASRQSSGDLMVENKSASLSTASSSSHEGTRRSRKHKEMDWKPTELDLSGILLLCALHAMSRDKATVFCLDNAMFMDEKSWVLATIIAKYFTNCMVLIGTRPPSLSLSENTQSSAFRRRLRVLQRMHPSVTVAMEPLGATEIHQLALQILKVQVIPSELVTILISRSQGNPLFLHEIIGEMQQQQVIKVDETRYRCYLQVQEPWGDKSSAHFCFHCYSKFANSKDKHRCKSCGYVFCSPCTPKACRKRLIGSTGDPVRHCSNCYTLSSTRRPSSDRSLAAATSDIASGTFGGVKQALIGGSSKHKRSMRSMFHAEPLAKPSLQPSLKGRIALRPPKTVKSVLTTMLDQLTVSQRMLMKTASVIGSVFEEELLRGATPIKASTGSFQQDLDDLERLAMIRRLDTFIAGLKSVPSDPSTSSACAVLPTPTRAPVFKVKYEFCHGFMQDVIRGQMLCSQLDKLSTRVGDCREQQQKELRQRFFAKAKDSLTRSMQVSVPVATTTTVRPVPGTPGKRRGSNPFNGQSARDRPRRRSLTSISDDLDVASASTTTVVVGGGDGGRGGGGGSSSRISSSSTSSHDDSGLTYTSSQPQSQPLPLPPALSPQRVLKTIPTFLRLKTGTVFVKKQSSLFSHLQFKGLTNARLWKKRYAVLHTSRLSLQYDEVHGAKPRQGTSLFLKGAKVHACDPEVAAKVHCFQVEVNEWTKGKYLMNQKRFFVVGVQSDAEVENWVFMIRYAIEALETQ